jgi:hypothetical protein
MFTVDLLPQTMQSIPVITLVNNLAWKNKLLISTTLTVKTDQIHWCSNWLAQFPPPNPPERTGVSTETNVVWFLGGESPLKFTGTFRMRGLTSKRYPKLCSIGLRWRFCDLFARSRLRVLWRYNPNAQNLRPKYPNFRFGGGGGQLRSLSSSHGTATKSYFEFLTRFLCSFPHHEAKFNANALFLATST